MVGGNPKTIHFPEKVDTSATNKVDGKPKTIHESDLDIISMDPIEKIDTLVRGHPKTSENSTETKHKVKAPKVFYAVAFGRKIGVYSNKWVETECLTKLYKGSRCQSFKNPKTPGCSF